MTERKFTVEEAHARRRHFARALGGRLTELPEYVYRRLGPRPSRHYFALRLPEGLLVWFECWCDHASVIEAKRQEAQLLAGQGFRVAFLHTTFSTRWAGERRPLLVAPPNSAVNFKRVAETLTALLSEPSRSSGGRG